LPSVTGDWDEEVKALLEPFRAHSRPFSDWRLRWRGESKSRIRIMLHFPSVTGDWDEEVKDKNGRWVYGSNFLQWLEIEMKRWKGLSALTKRPQSTFSDWRLRWRGESHCRISFHELFFPFSDWRLRWRGERNQRSASMVIWSTFSDWRLRWRGESRHHRTWNSWRPPSVTGDWDEEVKAQQFQDCRLILLLQWLEIEMKRWKSGGECADPLVILLQWLEIEMKRWKWTVLVVASLLLPFSDWRLRWRGESTRQFLCPKVLWPSVTGDWDEEVKVNTNMFLNIHFVPSVTGDWDEEVKAAHSFR